MLLKANLLAEALANLRDDNFGQLMAMEAGPRHLATQAAGGYPHRAREKAGEQQMVTLENIADTEDR